MGERFGPPDCFECRLGRLGFPDLVVSVELGSIPSQGAGARVARACPITEIRLRKRQDNDVHYQGYGRGAGSDASGVG